MTKARNILAVHYLLFLAFAVGCATAVIPKSPAQVVYQAHGDYAAALTIATQYSKLPACGNNTPGTLCRNGDTLKKLQDADDKAFDLLGNAQSAVRLGSVASDTEQSAAATRAQKAVADFSKLANSTKVKP